MELIIALFLMIFVVGVFTITEILLKRVTKYIERYHPYSILELLMFFRASWNLHRYHWVRGQLVGIVHLPL